MKTSLPGTFALNDADMHQITQLLYVSLAFQRHQYFHIPFGKTVNGNHTPSQVANQDLTGRFLLFPNQSDKRPVSGLCASDLLK